MNRITKRFLWLIYAAYFLTLILDLYHGFHFKGFLLGTIMLFFTTLIFLSFDDYYANKDKTLRGKNDK